MSDTPRTDAALDEGYLHITELGRMRKHAEQLERELDAWQSMACELAERLKMFGLCIPPEQPFGWQELLADFEKLKGVKP